MREIWKDIPNYEGLYQVSSTGRVKSIDRNTINKHGKQQKFNGTLRTQFLSDNGYYRVRLSKLNKGKYHPVHRLVALAFCPNFFDKPYINHKDGNKINNQFSNLEWVTQSENAKHAYRTGLADNKGENHSQSKLTNDDIVKIQMWKDVYSLSNNSLGKLFGVCGSTISNIINRKTWTHL